MSVISFTNIFSHPQGSHFVLLIVSFDVQKLLIGPNFAFLSFILGVQFSSAAQLCLTLCDSMNLSTPGLPVYQQTPRVYQNPCPLSRWCHPAISSIRPLSSFPQTFPASGYFPMSQLLTWCGQSIWVSASASVLPMNTQDWSPLGWTSWISLQSQGLSRVFPNTTLQKHQFFSAQLSS